MGNPHLCRELQQPRRVAGRRRGHPLLQSGQQHRHRCCRGLHRQHHPPDQPRLPPEGQRRDPRGPRQPGDQGGLPAGRHAAHQLRQPRRRGDAVADRPATLTAAAHDEETGRPDARAGERKTKGSEVEGE